MGLFDLFSKGKDAKAVYVPLEGEVIALSEIPDEVFSQGILGPGCGINPTGDTVYAPFDGTVSTVIDTKHAVGLLSNTGAEVLIHVGMDTVMMKGEGFTCHVGEGDKVTKGQKLLTFDPEKIREAGYPLTTAVVVCNPDEAGQPKAIASGKVTTEDVLFSL